MVNTVHWHEYWFENKAKNRFEDFFKLMNNSVFGFPKTELFINLKKSSNLRNHRDIKLVKSDKRRND